MNRVVKILIERDNVTKDEAINLVNETRELLLTHDAMDADDIIADILGLEPDYIIDILF